MVTWQKKDGRLEETSGKMSPYKHRLNFRSVQLTDDGEYECRASNSHGNASHTFTVSVEGQWAEEGEHRTPSERRRCSSDCRRVSCRQHRRTG